MAKGTKFFKLGFENKSFCVLGETSATFAVKFLAVYFLIEISPQIFS